MRVLFMDDMPERQRVFARVIGDHPEVEPVIAWDGLEAIVALGRNAFDLVYLDHDMGPNAYARYHDPSIPRDPREVDGMDVVNYILTLSPTSRPKRAVCHSFQASKREDMARRLREAGVPTLTGECSKTLIEMALNFPGASGG